MDEIIVNCPDPAGWAAEHVQQMAQMHEGIRAAKGVMPLGNGRFTAVRLLVSHGSFKEVAEGIAAAFAVEVPEPPRKRWWQFWK